MIEGKVKEEGIGEVIVESERRVNQRLVREAIERWDREGAETSRKNGASARY